MVVVVVVVVVVVFASFSAILILGTDLPRCRLVHDPEGFSEVTRSEGPGNPRFSYPPQQE